VSEEDVRYVFGPPWVQESLDFYRQRYAGAEKVVLRLRTLLREQDSSLPDIYDADAWAKIEQL
jgi:hypothetical protein